MFDIKEGFSPITNSSLADFCANSITKLANYSSAENHSGPGPEILVPIVASTSNATFANFAMPLATWLMMDTVIHGWLVLKPLNHSEACCPLINIINVSSI